MIKPRVMFHTSEFTYYDYKGEICWLRHHGVIKPMKAIDIIKKLLKTGQIDK